METDTTPENPAPPSSRSPSTPCYAVVACRWGWDNNGFSILCLTADKEKAIREADDYADYRGGKYGVGVFDEVGKQVYHSPSLYGETEIHRNHRMDTFERVGGVIVCALESGEKPDMKRAKERWSESVAMEMIFSKHNAKHIHPEPEAK